VKRIEGQIPNGGNAPGGRVTDDEMDDHAVSLPALNEHAVDEIEAEVARARLSFEQGLREASRVGARAARRLVTPALIGVGLAGGALLVLALVRLARRPPADGALIRIVVQTPRSPKRILPALGGAVARWLLERQLRGSGPLGTLARLSGFVDSSGFDSPGRADSSAHREARADEGWRAKRSTGRFES
jgi:hypothetical protein